MRAFALAAALLLPLPAGAAVELLDDWTTGLTHDVSTCNDRLMIFIVGAEHGTPPIGSITGVTWDCQALTPVGSAAVASGSENRLEIWYLSDSCLQGSTANAKSAYRLRYLQQERS